MLGAKWKSAEPSSQPEITSCFSSTKFNNFSRILNIRVHKMSATAKKSVKTVKSVKSVKTVKAPTRKSPRKGKIGDSVIALKPEKQNVVTKAVKHVEKLLEEKVAADAEASKYKRGIILLSHIPHGFYEKEMRAYFSQFGHVLRLRLARSKATGKSKGYAFIEFEFEDVAKIVSEAMNGYLMFERLMKCEVLPSTVNAKNIFSSSYIRETNYPKLKSRKYAKAQQNEPKSEEEVKEFLKLRLKKLDEQNKKLASMGIKYKYNPPKISKAKAKE